MKWKMLAECIILYLFQCLTLLYYVITGCGLHLEKEGANYIQECAGIACNVTCLIGALECIIGLGIVYLGSLSGKGEKFVMNSENG